MEAEERRLLAELRLALVCGVGPRTRKALLERFGSAAEALAAPADQLRETPGVGDELCRRIAAAPTEAEAEALLAKWRAAGVDVLEETDPQYPRLLREIYDPPAVLFRRGTAALGDELAVAVVGTRRPTWYGVRQGERLAAGLARAGFTVVSGLARGVDAAAHRGALAAGGRTIAVLASGVLEVYPPEHEELAQRIAGQGALVSESPPDHPPRGGAFPQRNRLITGMSLGVIVVEAGETSGALISARHAMEQGRDVFAVPGRVDQYASRGCHRLIRDGAALVERVEDVLDQLGPLVDAATLQDGRTIRHPAELTLNEQERRVLDAIGDGDAAVDELVRRSELPAHRVLATLTVLERRRLVRRLSGQRVARW